jgi:hypothetical protein
MSQFSAPNEFMCGTYVIEFDSDIMVSTFVERYASCPVWPIVTKGPREKQVFVLAVELKRQAHGDFSPAGNTLVKNPQLLGATAVRFKRDDSLLALLGGHVIRTGYSRTIPCGSSCENCPRYKNPCQGCPAYYEYDF